MKTNLKEIYAELDDAKFKLTPESIEWLIHLENVVVPLERLEQELRKRLALLDMRQVQSDIVMKEKAVIKQILGEA